LRKKTSDLKKINGPIKTDAKKNGWPKPVGSTVGRVAAGIFLQARAHGE
jgi:hypothetical protein